MGSALCRALIVQGHDVRGLTRDPARARERIGRELKLAQGSVAEPGQIARAAKGCDIVFHAAGLPPGPAPERVLRWLHIAGSENVLRAARHANVERVVHFSSAEVSLTGDDRMHWDEKRVLPAAPLGLFAQTKLIAEELLLSQGDDDLEVVALRPARVWGPDDVDGIARLAEAARSGAFRLYDGGRNIVATTHIDNLIKAALAAAAAERAPSRAYYITDGEFLEARELFGKLFAALGLPAPAQGSFALAWLRATVKEKLGSDGGAARLELLRVGKSALFDLSAAVHDLGYEPGISLDEKLVELSSWVSSKGGVDALIARRSRAPSARDVDAQVKAAGGD